MSFKAEFKCDGCFKKGEAKYNGEHYLPPQKWKRLYSDEEATALNIHFCDRCVNMVMTQPQVARPEESL